MFVWSLSLVKIAGCIWAKIQWMFCFFFTVSTMAYYLIFLVSFLPLNLFKFFKLLFFTLTHFLCGGLLRLICGILHISLGVWYISVFFSFTSFPFQCIQFVFHLNVHGWKIESRLKKSIYPNIASNCFITVTWEMVLKL